MLRYRRFNRIFRRRRFLCWTGGTRLRSAPSTLIVNYSNRCHKILIIQWYSLWGPRFYWWLSSFLNEQMLSFRNRQFLACAFPCRFNRFRGSRIATYSTSRAGGAWTTTSSMARNLHPLRTRAKWFCSHLEYLHFAGLTSSESNCLILHECRTQPPTGSFAYLLKLINFFSCHIVLHTLEC